MFLLCSHRSFRWVKPFSFPVRFLAFFPHHIKNCNLCLTDRHLMHLPILWAILSVIKSFCGNWDCVLVHSTHWAFPSAPGSPNSTYPATFLTCPKPCSHLPWTNPGTWWFDLKLIAFPQAVPSRCSSLVNASGHSVVLGTSLRSSRLLPS